MSGNALTVLDRLAYLHRRSILTTEMKNIDFHYSYLMIFNACYELYRLVGVFASLDLTPFQFFSLAIIKAY